MGRKKPAEKVIPLGELMDAKYSILDEQERNIVGKRLAEARKRKGVSRYVLADALAKVGCKISATSYGRWETGETYPNAYQLVAVCQVLDIDEDITFFTSAPKMQYLNEQGKKKVREYRDDLIATGRYTPKKLVSIERIRNRKMKKYLAPVSAGTGNFLEDGDFEMVDFPETAIPAGADFALTISGDSMEPVYQDGQIIWIQETTELRLGEEGIFIYDGQAYFKVLTERIEQENGEDVHIPVLRSYNEKYEPREVHTQLGFQVVGRVL
jgi:transcriptional regulator with XRE-family HTH domain